MASSGAIAAFLAALCGAEPVPLESLTLDFSKLPAKAKYIECAFNGQRDPNGMEFTLSTTVEENRVVLDDATAGRIDSTFRSVCEKNALLTLLHAEGGRKRPDGGEEKINIDFDAAKEVAIATAPDGKTKEHPFPKGTVSVFAMLRIVGLLPQEEGKRYAIVYLIEPEGGPEGEPPFVIECKGQDTIERDGKTIDCARFELNQTAGGRRPLVLFVDNDHVLQRFAEGDRDFFDLVPEDLEKAPSKRSPMKKE